MTLGRRNCAVWDFQVESIESHEWVKVWLPSRYPIIYGTHIINRKLCSFCAASCSISHTTSKTGETDHVAFRTICVKDVQH